MADEITVSMSMAVSNGNLSFSRNVGSKSFDQAAVGGPTPAMLTIGTIEESVAFSELTTVGWVLMENLDSINYVEWGFSSGTYGGRMEAGESALFRLNPSTTLYMRANTASCAVTVYALED